MSNRAQSINESAVEADSSITAGGDRATLAASASVPALAGRSGAVGRITLVALLLNIGCVTTAELLLRTGASAAVTTSVFGLAALKSPATVVGICFHVAAFGCWMYALRTVPLTLAYNFTAVNQGLVPIAAWLVLPNEHISVMRWVGIGLVLCGFVLLVPMLAKVEHETEVVEGGAG